MYCQLCKQELTDPVSIARGMGPDCAAKYADYLAACDTDEAEIGRLTLSGDATVQRWLANFAGAAKIGHRVHGHMFISAARRAAQQPPTEVEQLEAA